MIVEIRRVYDELKTLIDQYIMSDQFDRAIMLIDSLKELNEITTNEKYAKSKD